MMLGTACSSLHNAQLTNEWIVMIMIVMVLDSIVRLSILVL